jgi:MFS family permease
LVTAQSPTGTSAAIPPDAASTGIFAALRVPGYPRLWASGWIWNLTRWMAVFLCSYLVNQRTGSPLLVQLVGAAFYLPILLGGALGGVVSDRFDRRRAIMWQQVMLFPLAALMGGLTMTNRLQVWMIYPFILAVGIGWVIDLTSRRSLVFDMVGAGRITNAMALESMSMTGGAMLGNLIGGTVINFIGPGQTFLTMCLMNAAVWVLLLGLPAVRREHVPVGGTSIRSDLAEGLRYVLSQPLLLSILGVTILVNFFYYPYQPLVPLFAGRLEVNAFWAGLLAACAGMGAIIAAVLIAGGRRPSRGWTYLGGSLLAMFGVFVFALSRWYPVSMVGLMLAGGGQACYVTMQGALTLAGATPAMRGRAIGVISMGIGVLPISLPIVGLAAEIIGPVAALAGTAALGMMLLAFWTFRSANLRAVA